MIRMMNSSSSNPTRRRILASSAVVASSSSRMTTRSNNQVRQPQQLQEEEDGNKDHRDGKGRRDEGRRDGVFGSSGRITRRRRQSYSYSSSAPLLVVPSSTTVAPDTAKYSAALAAVVVASTAEEEEEEAVLDRIFATTAAVVTATVAQSKSPSSLTTTTFTTTTTTTTKSGWCLRQAMIHCYAVNNGQLAPLIERHGPPGYYSCCISNNPNNQHNPTQQLKDPQTCFQSLVRIVAGQFISGQAAQAAWKRILDLAAVVAADDDDNENDDEKKRTFLTEDTILQRVEKYGIELGLQRPAGITKAKAASIVDLATRFRSGELCESLLRSSTLDDDTIRKVLLKVRGIGPWTCDMFFMFYLERPNVLPLGDLGVRKGIAKHFFSMKGGQKQKQLCPKKDGTRIRELLQPYEPYLSLVTYYMWRVADTPVAMETTTASSTTTAAATTTTTANTTNITMTPPSKKKRRRKVVSQVTP